MAANRSALEVKPARTRPPVGRGRRKFGAALSPSASSPGTQSAWRRAWPPFRSALAGQNPRGNARRSGNAENLGLALSSLGGLAGDPKRLEEAVAAFRSALEVLPAKMPAIWAIVHNNLAMALKSLGRVAQKQYRSCRSKGGCTVGVRTPPDNEYKDTLQQIDTAIAELATSA